MYPHAPAPVCCVFSTHDRYSSFIPLHASAAAANVSERHQQLRSVSKLGEQRQPRLDQQQHLAGVDRSDHGLKLTPPRPPDISATGEGIGLGKLAKMSLSQRFTKVYCRIYFLLETHIRSSHVSCRDIKLSPNRMNR